MQVKIVESDSIVSLVTDKLNGTRFTFDIAKRMFKYRSDGYGIRVPSKKVLEKLNNFARASYNIPVIDNIAIIPASKLLQ